MGSKAVIEWGSTPARFGVFVVGGGGVPSVPPARSGPMSQTTSALPRYGVPGMRSIR